MRGDISVEDLFILVIVILVRKPPRHSHGLVGRIDNVFVIRLGQFNENLCCLLRTDAGHCLNSRQPLLFVRQLCGGETCNVRPGGIHFPVPRSANRLIVNVLVF